MADTLIAAGRVVPATGTQTLSPGFVRFSGGVVTEVGGGRPAEPPDFDLADGVLVPGFVDLQVNGHFGVDLAVVATAGWATVVRRLPETGTTAFLPTFVTAPVHRLAGALRAVEHVLPGLPLGSRVLGVHLEGPFISLRHRGAHDPEWIIDPEPEAVEELMRAGGGALRLVTLAPERHGAMAAINLLADAGVRVSVGHTDATSAQVAAAVDAGARMVTHLFNAQTGMHHREPGVVGEALGDPRITCGLIADLHHVAPIVCKIAFAAAAGRIAIVTDAAACAGMPAGRYQLGGQLIQLPAGDGVPPVRADGRLAGSALRMDVGVSNMVAVGVDLTAAIAAATRIPADFIGRPDLGRICKGSAADLVWLGDDLRTRSTWIAGDLVYSAILDSTRRSHHSFAHEPSLQDGSLPGHRSSY